MIRVLLADDHGIVRDGLALVLERDPSIEIVSVVADGEAALAAIRDAKPDVAILDISMPGLTGIEVCRRARDESLKSAVLLLSVHKEASFVTSGLEAGASGYVVKDAAGKELIDAVQTVAAGEVYLSREVSGAVVQAMRGGKKETKALTPREREVLGQVASGLTSKEIAAKLSIATKTVDTHRAAIMQKLDIRHVAGLTKYAIRHHLTSLDG